MHPTGVASAAWVFAAAPSKAPYYVAGAVLAGWAVLLALSGLSRPGFPGSPRAARLVMLTSVVLVAATIATAIVTAGEEAPSEAGGRGAEAAGTATAASGALRLTADPMGLLAYEQKRATVEAGKVAISFVNRSPIPHDVTIAKGTKTIARTKTITGSTTSATAQLAAGGYVFYCSVDGHRQAGMQGTLTVR